ncbi:MAG: translocation/assembly module TamB domain-containing protein [Burkholderiales bacterium]|nr:translocation/assembly module TamB domain-containing protein [Burkholderiales bacterium]
MRWRKAWRWALWVGVAAAIALVALGWFLTTDWALRWALARAADAAGGRLTFEGVARAGLETLHVERVLYRGEAVEVDARAVRLSISIASLRDRRVLVHELAADAVRIAMKDAEAEPARLPPSLALPARFEVRALKLRRLVLERPQGDIELAGIDLALRYDAGSYALVLRSLDSQWGALAGSLRLAGAAPFPLEGMFSLSPRDPRLGKIALALAGELSALGIGAVGAVHGSIAHVQAACAPFAAGTLLAVDARIASLDTRAWYGAAPRARLDIGVSAAVERSARARGRLHAINREPGAAAAGRAPIVTASAGFEGSGTSWRLHDIDVDAGRTGRLRGEAKVEAQSVIGALAVRRLDLRTLHERLHATAMAGPIQIDANPDRVLLRGALEQPGSRIAFAARYSTGRIEIESARWRGAAGELNLQGTMQTAAPYAFQASGTARGLDPSRLGDYPAAAINARFDGRGQVEPIDVALALAIDDGRYRGHVLSGAGRLHYQPNRISEVDMALRLANARLDVRGSFGASADSLGWSVHVPELGKLHARAAGRLKAAGTLRGAWRAPALDFDLDSTGLRWGEGMAAARLAGRGALAEGLDGRVDIALDATGIRLGEIDIARGRVNVAGTRARHEASLTASARGYEFDARAAGALVDGPLWQGILRAFELRGPIATRLEQPVDIVAGASAVRIGAARLRLGAGTIEVASFDWGPGRLASRGALSGIALDALRPVLSLPPALGTLVVAGAWDVELADSLSGSMSLRREAGDIMLPGSPPLAAKLRALAIDARGEGAQIVLRAELDSATFGRVEARGTTRASRRGGSWGVAGDAPIDVRVSAHMPALAWTRPWLEGRASLEGRAELAMHAGGTLAQPYYAGELRASDLALGLAELGVQLRNGRLDARFDGQDLVLRTLRFETGDGVLTGSGKASLVPGRLAAHVTLDATRLPLLSRPNRLVVVSGQASLAWDASQLRARGRVTAERGLIELPRADTPSPSRDVLVLGTKPAAVRDMKLQAEFALDLGKDFVVRGRGISTRLAGTLHAALAPDGRPVLNGTLRAVDGTYSAFGQKLAIERGTLTFVGPVENPALDILAVRKTASVEVGVAIGGSALLPRIRLVSTPPMADADKLAWLTLGHGLDQTGGNEAAALQAAAQALLARGADPNTQASLASRLGLDELSLGTVSATGERVVSVGKRLASNVYIGFERGVTGAVNVIRVTYDLSRRWSVQARAGTENALDLFYTLGFR